MEHHSTVFIVDCSHEAQIDYQDDMLSIGSTHRISHDLISDFGVFSMPRVKLPCFSIMACSFSIALICLQYLAVTRVRSFKHGYILCRLESGWALLAGRVGSTGLLTCETVE